MQQENIEYPAKGAIILPGPSGPVVFTLEMANPETISADDLFQGTPQIVMFQKGQAAGPPQIGENIHFQSSLWRNSNRSFSLIIFSKYFFVNECVVPVFVDGEIKFKLATADMPTGDGVLTSHGRAIAHPGDAVNEDIIPNVECFLKATDFGWDGFVTMIRFAENDYQSIEFGVRSPTVTIYTAGAILGSTDSPIPKLYKIPVHNMYPEGRWCIKNDSLPAVLNTPTSMSPNGLFHDLMHSPANFDLSCSEHTRIMAEPIIGAEDEGTVPMFRLFPEPDAQMQLINISLPPVWPYLQKF